MNRVTYTVTHVHALTRASFSQIGRACKKFESTTMRRLLLDEGIRPDGRAVDEVRPISSRCGPLPRTHGSVLFTRGETQTICVTTLGNSSSAQMAESLQVCTLHCTCVCAERYLARLY